MVVVMVATLGPILLHTIKGDLAGFHKRRVSVQVLDSRAPKKNSDSEQPTRIRRERGSPSWVTGHPKAVRRYFPAKNNN